MGRHLRRLVTLVAIVLALGAVSAPGVLADGVKGVTVKPLTVKPGDPITVKGDKLGPGSKVEVRVIGAGVDVDLGEVQADAGGDFSSEFRLPADLKPGTYTIKATGAESATTQLTVVGGAVATSPTAMAAAPVRTRPLGEALGLVALFGVLAGAGLFLARVASAREAKTAS